MPCNDLAKALRRKGLAVVAFLFVAVPTAFAGSLEQAKRIHDRIAGVPPSDAVLLQMAADIDNGDAIGAAFRAMDNANFYNITLKNFAAPWTNRAESVFVPLNDYIATVIGMVRDDVPFNTLLSADIVYVGNGGPAYSVANNNHYQTMEDNGTDLSTALTQTTQSSVNGLPSAATAGIMTTRGAAEAFFVAGTNRAMFRFTMLNHMCHDMEQVRDVTRAPDRIRQDVSRSPGGDSRIFLNNCVGCHSGMDALAGAFAFYNFDEETETFSYSPAAVDSKYFNNDANFAFGFRTGDDSWTNYWRQGPNSLLGWDPNLPGSGNGAKSLGQEMANSDAFAECQVTKVFRNMCFRDPTDTADRNQVAAMVASFQNSGYRMKQVFAEAATYCMGD
ncbi:MAG: hypothetical protein AAF438_08825 [Pseudomonadota bacterium]